MIDGQILAQNVHVAGTSQVGGVLGSLLCEHRQRAVPVNVDSDHLG